MEQERSAQRARKKASVPMTAASDFVVPEGTDELSRSTRRAWRERLNDASSRKMITGVLATLAGGSFWGFRAPARASCSILITLIPCGL